jgi:hypothetical protein
MTNKKKPTIGSYAKRKKNTDSDSVTVEVIVPPGLKIQRLPSISREEYFKGDNYYFKKANRLFSS